MLWIPKRELSYATLPTFLCPWHLGFCKARLLKLRENTEASLSVRVIMCPLNRPVDQFSFSKCYFLLNVGGLIYCLKITIIQIPVYKVPNTFFWKNSNCNDFFFFFLKNQETQNPQVPFQASQLLETNSKGSHTRADSELTRSDLFHLRKWSGCTGEPVTNQLIRRRAG